MLRFKRRTVGAVTACALALLTVFPMVAQAGPITDVLPDLQMALPSQFHLEQQGNHRWLRFTAIIENRGDGPLDVRGKRICKTCVHMTTRQFVLQSDGSWRIRPTDAKQRYSTASNHNHWHVIGMERYELFPMTAPFPDGSVVGHKYGFCFFDGLPVDRSLPNSPGSPQYSYYSCGTPTSRRTHVGLSVGYGDIYPWNFAGQYINVKQVPAGDYLVCLGADPGGDFTETIEDNNETWQKITLAETSPGTWTLTADPAARGDTPCQSQLPYPVSARSNVGGSPHLVTGSVSAAVVPGAAATVDLWTGSASPDLAAWYGTAGAPALDCTIAAVSGTQRSI
ncbi:MAG: hypothetical protein QOH61_2703 [Chloroflexota bacterium]|nr:hypothetical protein [Chloroflexota bacterium]